MTIINRPFSMTESSCSVKKQRKFKLQRRRRDVADETIRVSPIASAPLTKMLTKAIQYSECQDDTRFQEFEYNFENISFEGGGNKGMAYVGALEVGRMFPQSFLR